MLPISRKTYWFDLEKANETGTPDWQLYTDWTVDLGLTDLSPASMAKFADKLASDEATASDYLNRSRRDAGGPYPCDSGCMTAAVCEARFIDPYMAA